MSPSSLAPFRSRGRRPAALLAGALLAAPAFAHVALPPGGAVAGSTLNAAFRVGHACTGAQSTTALRVRIPAGFTVLEAQPREGWKLVRSAQEVRWEAERPAAALRDGDRTPFIIRGRVGDQPGTLWFPVLQSCDKGSADWAEIPASAGAQPAYPAVRLDVLPAGTAAVDVRDAWARVTVAGQTATGVFARLTAPSGSRLVGGTSPIATGVEVHEMKMDGNIMRMRTLDQGLELPAGESVELRPGGLHLMLTGLKQALPVGSTVPVVLQFVDAEGRRGSRSLQVPVRAAPAGTPAHDHAHGQGHSHGHGAAGGTAAPSGGAGHGAAGHGAGHGHRHAPK